MPKIIPTSVELALIAAMRATYGAAEDDAEPTTPPTEDVSGDKPAKAKKKPTPEPEPEAEPEGPTVDDVRAILKKVIKATDTQDEGEEQVARLLKKFGADELPEVDASDYAKLIAKAKGMLA